MRLRFRGRLTLALTAVVVVSVVALGAAAYLVARTSLRAQAERRAVDDAQFVVGVLVPTRLAPRADVEEIATSALIDDLRRSVDGFAVRLDGRVVESSGFAFSDPPSRAMTELVSEGRIAQSWVDINGTPYVLVGARQPEGRAEFYLYEDASATVDALVSLRNALVGAGFFVVLLGVGAAGWIARRVLRPVSAASVAAAWMAAGDLTTRVDRTGQRTGDEFDTWAADFNAMAESLERTISDLEAARDEQRRFVADVSHELRTPLTALVNEAALLADVLARNPGRGDVLDAWAAADDAELHRVAELLTHDVGRLRILVQDLLEVSRLDAGADATRLEWLDPHWLVEFVAACGVSAPVEIGDDSWYASERRRLERIVGNVLDNAQIHGGGVQEVVRRRDGEFVVIEVIDAGPGVREADREAMFARFVKLDRSCTGSGSGLGLAIVWSYASTIGGSVSAEPALPTGLRVSLRFPAVPTDEEGRAVLPERAPDVVTEP